MTKKDLDLVVVLTTRNGNGSITFSCLTELCGWVQNTYYGYGMRDAKKIFKSRIMDLYKDNKKYNCMVTI